MLFCVTHILWFFSTAEEKYIFLYMDMLHNCRSTTTSVSNLGSVFLQNFYNKVDWLYIVIAMFPARALNESNPLVKID